MQRSFALVFASVWAISLGGCQASSPQYPDGSLCAWMNNSNNCYATFINKMTTCLQGNSLRNIAKQGTLSDDGLSCSIPLCNDAGVRTISADAALNSPLTSDAGLDASLFVTRTIVLQQSSPACSLTISQNDTLSNTMFSLTLDGQDTIAYACTCPSDSASCTCTDSTSDVPGQITVTGSDCEGGVYTGTVAEAQNCLNYTSVPGTAFENTQFSAFLQILGAQYPLYWCVQAGNEAGVVDGSNFTCPQVGPTMTDSASQ
jgi:hypothetical protein